jgi:signal transduction histidine kinase
MNRKPAASIRRENASKQEVSLPATPSAVRVSGGHYPFELQCRLLEAETMPEVLDTAASMLARVPGTIGAWIFQRNADGLLILVRSWRATNADVDPPSSEWLGHLIHQRWIAAHRLGQTSTDFAKPFSPTGVPGSLVVPMMIGEELVGAFAVQRRDGETFPYLPEDLITLASIAALTAQQMQMTVLRERVGNSVDRAQLRQEIKEEAYRYVAHELHDGVVQDLAYMRLRLEMLERVIREDPERGIEEITILRGQFNNAIDGFRELVNELRKPRRQALGITGQLRDIAGRMAGQRVADEQPQIELDLQEISGVRLEPEVERAVVGIIREAMQNIRKHAGASSVHVEVQQLGDMLEVEVRDDGTGFTMEQQDENDHGLHFGVSQMRELAEDMGGSLDIHSEYGKGTAVQARIPLVPTRKR